MDRTAIMATNRFGLGAKKGDVDAATAMPKQWVKAQLIPIMFSTQLPSTAEAVSKLRQHREQRKRAKKLMSAKPTDFQNKWFQRYLADYFQLCVATENSVGMRLLRFWTNHFSVSARTQTMQVLAPLLQREAIAPFYLGKFEDLLLSVVKHPAMLVYLDNHQSIGPNSAAAKKRGGLNENLAREIMELHTLGVSGGYSQSDVTELAKGLTGWSINYSDAEVSGPFLFRDYAHEPGSRQFRGSDYSQGGIKQATDMLISLARDPATAEFVCRKLVTHFINDEADQELVAACVGTWRKTGGDILQVMFTLIDHPLSWQQTNIKYKTPEELVISSLRGLGLKKWKPKLVMKSLSSMGHVPYKAESPEGYSDQQLDWHGSTALMARLDWCHQISQFSRKSPVSIMQTMLADTVSERSFLAVKGAESRQQGTTLLLMSPEFQWR